MNAYGLALRTLASSSNTENKTKPKSDNRGYNNDLDRYSEVNQMFNAWINYLNTGVGSRMLALPDVLDSSAFKTTVKIDEITIPANTRMALLFLPTNDITTLLTLNMSNNQITPIYRYINDVSNSYEAVRMNAYRLHCKIMLPSNIINLVESEMNVAIVPVFSDILSYVQNLGSIQYTNPNERMLNCGSQFSVAGRGVIGSPMVPTSSSMEYNSIRWSGLLVANLVYRNLYIPPASFVNVRIWTPHLGVGIIVFGYRDTFDNILYTTTLNIIAAQNFYQLNVLNPINSIAGSLGYLVSISFETPDIKDEAIVATISSSDLPRTLRYWSSIFIQGVVKSTLITDIPLEAPPKRKYVMEAHDVVDTHLKLYREPPAFHAASFWETARDHSNFQNPNMSKLLSYASESVEGGGVISNSRDFTASTPKGMLPESLLKPSRCVYCRRYNEGVYATCLYLCVHELSPCSHDCVVYTAKADIDRVETLFNDYAAREIELKHLPNPSDATYHAMDPFNPDPNQAKDKKGVPEVKTTVETEYSWVAYSYLQGHPIVTNNPALEIHPVTLDPVSRYIGKDIAYTSLLLRTSYQFVYIIMDSIESPLDVSIRMRDKKMHFHAATDYADYEDKQENLNYSPLQAHNIRNLIEMIPIHLPTEQAYSGNTLKINANTNPEHNNIAKYAHNWRYNWFPLLTASVGKMSKMNFVSLVDKELFEKTVDEATSLESVDVYAVMESTFVSIYTNHPSPVIHDYILQCFQYSLIKGAAPSKPVMVYFLHTDFDGSSFALALVSLILGLPCGKNMSGCIGRNSISNLPELLFYNMSNPVHRNIVISKTSCTGEDLPLIILAAGFKMDKDHKLENHSSKMGILESFPTGSAMGLVSAYRIKISDQLYSNPIVIPSNTAELFVSMCLDITAFAKKPSLANRSAAFIDTETANFNVLSWAAAFSGNMDNLNFVRCWLQIKGLSALTSESSVVDDQGTRNKSSSSGTKSKIKYTESKLKVEQTEHLTKAFSSVYNRGNSVPSKKPNSNAKAKPSEDIIVHKDDLTNSKRSFKECKYPINFNRTNLANVYYSVLNWLSMNIDEKAKFIAYMYAVTDTSQSSTATLPLYVGECMISALGRCMYPVMPKIKNKVQMLRNASSYFANRSLNQFYESAVNKMRLARVFIPSDDDLRNTMYSLERTITANPAVKKEYGVNVRYDGKYMAVASSKYTVYTRAKFDLNTNIGMSLKEYLKDPHVMVSASSFSHNILDENKTLSVLKSSTGSQVQGGFVVKKKPLSKRSQPSPFKGLLALKLAESCIVPDDYTSEDRYSDDYLLERFHQEVFNKICLLSSQSEYREGITDLGQLLAENINNAHSKLSGMHVCIVEGVMVWLSLFYKVYLENDMIEGGKEMAKSFNSTLTTESATFIRQLERDFTNSKLSFDVPGDDHSQNDGDDSN